MGSISANRSRDERDDDTEGLGLREHRLDIRELFRLETDLVGVPRRLGAVLAVFGAAASLDVEQSAELDLVGRMVQAVDRGLRGIIECVVDVRRSVRARRGVDAAFESANRPDRGCGGGENGWDGGPGVGNSQRGR